MEKNISKAIIALGFVAASIICMAQVAHCQTLQLGVAAINTEYRITNPVEIVQDNQGISATLNAKVYQTGENSRGRVRVGVVFNYQRDSFEFPTDTYAFGPELAVAVAKTKSLRLDLYAQARLGFDTTYNQDKNFSREYVFGPRLVLGNFYIEPIGFGYKRTEGFLSPSTHKLYAGLGVSFW